MEHANHHSTHETEIHNSSLISRRTLLAGSIASLFASNTTLGNEFGNNTINQQSQLSTRASPPAHSKKISSVNDFLQNCPKAHSIPGMHSKKLHLEENAHYGLIHFRMIHWAPDETEEGLKEILECQQELLSGMQYLMEHPYVGMDHVYGEGLSEKTNIPQFLNSYVDKQYDDWENYALTYWGAEAVLQSEHKLVVLPAEREHIRDRVDSIYRNSWQNREKREECHDCRENEILKIMQNSKRRISFVVYGAAHNWRNNLDAWNATNKNAKFSLLEYTPRAVHRYIDIPQRIKRGTPNVPTTNFIEELAV